LKLLVLNFKKADYFTRSDMRITLSAAREECPDDKQTSRHETTCDEGSGLARAEHVNSLPLRRLDAIGRQALCEDKERGGVRKNGNQA
jgi:hypothetical protein